MLNKENLQDLILTRLQREHQVVTVIVTNGFQQKGWITGFDQEVLVLEIRGEQQIIYKHAVSTIIPDTPVDLDEQKEEP